MDATQFQKDILLNQERWNKKPLLRAIYREFHTAIAAHLSGLENPLVVDLGSGIGNIKDVIPDCLRTDLFPNPWIDQVENAYALSFADGTVSDLVLFDVFHHLRYPGTALREFERVLRPGGRVLIFDPFISLLGLIVYGLLHQEPIGWRDYIDWFAPKGWSAQNSDYYAAQGNTTRIFFGRLDPALLKSWKVHPGLLPAQALGKGVRHIAQLGYRRFHFLARIIADIARVVNYPGDRNRGNARKPGNFSNGRHLWYRYHNYSTNPAFFER